MNEKYEEIVLKLRNAGKESFLFGDLLREAADAIEELSKENESFGKDLTSAVEMLKKKRKPKWIPCSKRLPEPEGCRPYLVTEAHYNPNYEGRFVTIDWYDARDPECVPFWIGHRGNDGIRVVAWMPLPEPPRESES